MKICQSGACYCRSSSPNHNNKKSDDDCEWKCTGNQSEICGDDKGITVSRIDQTNPCDSNPCKHGGTCTPTTTGYTCICPRNFGGSNCDRLSIEPVTVSVRNEEASVSIRQSTTAYFMRVITSDTSPAILTQNAPSIIQEIISTTSENDYSSISTSMIKTSTQATTAIGEWGMWDDWKFCEVNCVREDTEDGKQRRMRICNISSCSGGDMEERSCLRPGICKGMRPRKLLCKCPKRLINTKWHFLDGKNITNSEVKKLILEDFNKNTQSEISVDKKTISKEIRKKNSSVNKRKSSQSIGWGCIVFFVMPIVFLIAIDILNCCIHFRSRFGGRKRNRIIPISSTQDQRDCTKPLQENVNADESYCASRCCNDFRPDEMKRETYQRRRDDNNQLGTDEWMQYT
ncbi:Hypothetical predicted protein [Mytilus galloprovincialis]|uniref:EGF-like domain-containing protein n=1 Tax=Mytilus galloprovincialis TaxID=29158 RepID=A0A8B6E577_MYTGA|nr:Hypothetical predicted protein [Mytilus galloprovincialis]